MTGIVVGVDGSESAGRALRWACREAELHGWPVTAVLSWSLLDQHHADGRDEFDPHYGEDDASVALDAYVDRAVGAGRAGAVGRRVVCDLPARALLEASADASLLVVGARGLGGFRELLLGSVSAQCLHHSTGPVAVVRGGDDVDPLSVGGRVVVGVDGSDTAMEALRWAVREAALRGATLEVVHAWQVPYIGEYVLDPEPIEGRARATLDAAVDGVDTTGLAAPPERTLSTYGAAEAILDTAAGADLVVVGSRGTGGFKGLLVGSVSSQVVHHAGVPVVVVPAAG